MSVLWNVVRVAIVAIIVVAVAELSKRLPRASALMLSLPIVSILAFVFAWLQHHDLPTISRMARETLILVPLCLPFFVPLAFAERLGLSFSSSLVIGLLLALLSIGAWLYLAAENRRCKGFPVPSTIIWSCPAAYRGSVPGWKFAKRSFVPAIETDANRRNLLPKLVSGSFSGSRTFRRLVWFTHDAKSEPRV